MPRKKYTSVLNRISESPLVSAENKGKLEQQLIRRVHNKLYRIRIQPKNHGRLCNNKNPVDTSDVQDKFFKINTPLNQWSPMHT
jgi:hypothetical protein